jgi:DNA-binding transcriptional LysR family regulator
MDTLFSMKVFRQVVEMKSFVSASDKLDISTAMTSKHVKHLEEYLGVRLLNRTSRNLSLTDEGKIYYDSCAEILNELEEAESALKCSSVIPRGVLKVAAPVWFNISNFTDGISQYCEKYPEVIIDFILNDRMVDLVEEGIDIALRVTSEPHSTLIARRISQINFNIVGSPKYLAKHGRPSRPEDLLNHKFIVNNSTKQKNNLYFKCGEEQRHIEVKSVLNTNNTTLISQAAASGIGLAFLPAVLIKDEALVNKLEIVLPELSFPPVYLYAVYSSRRFLSPRVRTFIDFMVDWFKKI